MFCYMVSHSCKPLDLIEQLTNTNHQQLNMPKMSDTDTSSFEHFMFAHSRSFDEQ